MPVLEVGDPLPGRPARVLVAGTSGAGKSTLARAVAERLGAPYVEIDSLYHGPGWVPRPEFVADVDAFTSASAWVCEWQYAEVRGLLAGRADLMVWLDLPRAVVIARVVQRTVRRRLRREVLWNGNREAPLRTVLHDREHIVRWAWTTHAGTADRVQAVAREHPRLVVVRLRTPRQVREWLETSLSG